MVTNTVQDLAEDHLNYTFILNAQGRIQVGHEPQDGRKHGKSKHANWCA